MCQSCDAFVSARSNPRAKLLPLPKGATWPGTSKRPLKKVYDDAVYDDAVADAKRLGWPGEYNIVGTRVSE